MLDALGNIGDFIGGLAVVVTLIYLAVQVRQNSSQIENNSRIVAASSHQQLTQLIEESNSKIATNREFAELLNRARQEGLGPLDEVDRMRALAWTSSLFRRQHNIEQLYAAGLIDADEYAGRAEIMKVHLRRKGTREAWQILAPTFSNRFQTRIQSLIEEADDVAEGTHQP